MDVEYFKRQICDELCGAEDYAKRAIEIKPMSATWSAKLLEMSTQELDHAKKLFAMWQEYYGIQIKNREQDIPKYLEDANSEITDMYLEGSAKAQMMQVK